MKVVLTECVVRNVFEKPKMLDDYTMLHPKLILSEVVELENNVVDYSIVKHKLSDFIDRNSTPLQNEHKTFISEFNHNLDSEHDESFIKSFSFEILRIDSKD